MKIKNLVFVSLFSLFFIFSCSKETIRIFEPGDMEHGFASAKKGGQDWLSSGTGVEEDWSEETISVLMETFNEVGSFRERLGINEVPLLLGLYEVGNVNNFNDGIIGGHYGVLGDGGDAVEDIYILDTIVSTNFVEITLVDTSTRKIEGFFDLSFIISPTREKTNPDNPDKIRFSEGMFSVDILE